MPNPPATAPDAEEQPSRSGWMASLAVLPRYILQPFSLAAVAVVGAILLGVSGAGWAAVAALVTAVALLVIGLRGTPREAVGLLVAGATYRQVSHISGSTPVDRAGLTHDHGGLLSPLQAICFLHLYVREGGSVGRSRIFPMDYFVDLMTAALVPSHLECMVHDLVDHVRRSGKLSGVTTVAAPKRGNALLLAAAAREFDLEPLLIKEMPLFGKLVEGIGGRPKKAVLLDDISSDGELLVNCVKVLRQYGYEVTDAFVLIDRPEGDAREALEAVGVTLSPLCSLGDPDLESIAAHGRRSRAI